MALSAEMAVETKKEVAPKSSTEILSELFGVFNAKPPSITEDILSDGASKKRKKSKKKSKHKKKKKKKSQKRGRSGSDASDSESESESLKKKAKKTKRKKRKRKHSEDEAGSALNASPKSDGSAVEQLPLKRAKVRSRSNSDRDRITVKIENDKNDEKPEIIIQENITMNEIPIPKTPDVSKIKLPEERKPAVDPSDKSKIISNKIQIKNLKFSSVYEATVKQVEEEARKKAEKYEDGELTDTSNSSADGKVTSEGEAEVEITDVPDLREKIKCNNSTKVTEKTSSKSSSHTKKDKSSRKSRSKSRTKSHKSSRRKSTSKSRRSASKSRRSVSKSRRSGSKSRRSASKSRRSTSKTRRSDSKCRRSGSKSRRSGSKSRLSGSKSPESHRSRSRHKTRHGRSTSRSRSKHHREKYDEKRSHRHRSKEKDSRIEIDKKRLLEIARKNAITMLQTGTLPAAANLGTQAQKNVITAIKCGGKSVDELTDFCKNLSRQEAIGELSSVSSVSEGEDGADSTLKPFNNPFQIKDRAPIVLNIKGGTNLPTQSFQEKTIEQTKVLRQQFPVSSGSQHRGAENEWRPVSPPTVAPVISNSKSSQNYENSVGSSKYMGISSDKINYSSQNNTLTPNDSTPQSTIPGMNQPNVPAIPPGPQVFPNEVNVPAMDIGSIVSQRLTAIRRLQQNPNDTAAMNQMYQANQEMSKWATSKQEPGAFTGSTGAQILTPKELASGYQAWARKDQLQTAAPVNSGMGMHLLQKMGWKPGEGLGKQKNGALTPLLLEVKLDTRGLVAKEETRQRNNSKRPYVPTVKTLAGKHPVSLLGEYCSKRKLGVPSYNLCFECGPDHKKNFLFKVTVNGIEYQPSVASANKKQAKADAATVCLQKLGLIQ